MFGYRTTSTTQPEPEDATLAEPTELSANPALMPPEPPTEDSPPTPPPHRTPASAYLTEASPAAAPKAWEGSERAASLSALQLLQAGAANAWQEALHRPPQMRMHCDALLTTIGGPAQFVALDLHEQRRRVHVLTRFLNSVTHHTHDDGGGGEGGGGGDAERSVTPRSFPPASKSEPPPRTDGDDGPTAGDSACSTPHGHAAVSSTSSSSQSAGAAAERRGSGLDAEAVAESLAQGLRRVDVLASIAAMAHKGGYDGQLALSCLANLARLGLVDALCNHPKVRGAIVAALMASRHDEGLAPYALPCAFNCCGHPLLLRAMRHTPHLHSVLLRWVHEDDLADIVTPGGSRARRAKRGRSRQRLPKYFDDAEFEATMARCATTILRNVRASKVAQRASIGILRDQPRPAFPHTASAPTRLAAWLVGWRPSPPAGHKGMAKGSSSSSKKAAAPMAETCIEV